MAEVYDFTPKEGNMDVFQSWIFSNARMRMNLAQTRMLLRIVEIAQREVHGKIVAKHLAQWEHTLTGVRIRMPMRAIMAEKSKHYEEVQEAILGMLKMVCQMWSSRENSWRASGLISDVKIIPRSGIIEFSVPDFIWDALLDFSKGFRRYELGKALALKSPHSIRMYMLISGQASPLTYTMEQLRELFGVVGKYPQSHDFVKKVLLPSKAELDKVCPWSLDWSYIKQGRKVTAITLKPYPIAANRDQELESARLAAKAATRPLLGNVYDYLTQQCGFSLTELKSHTKMLHEFHVLHPRPLEFLASVNARRRTKDGRDRGKAWIIGAIRGEMAALAPS